MGTSGTPVGPLPGESTSTADLIARVRDMLAEEDADLYDNTEIIAAINAGVVTLFSELPVLPARTTVNVVAGTDTYAMPVDFGRFGKVLWGTESIPLAVMMFDEIPAGVTPGKPTAYNPEGLSATGARQIQLHPEPSGNGTLTINYFRIPAMLSVAPGAEADPTWHRPFHYLPCYYAASVLLPKDKREESSNLRMMQFELGIKDYRKWYYKNLPYRAQVREQAPRVEM